MSMVESRRDFLKKSTMLIGGAAVLGSAALTGCTSADPKVEDVNAEIPAHPYEYVKLDADNAEKIAYEGYFEDGCCYGVAKALLTELGEKVGFPYTAVPAAMFANGKEGYTCGTLCGALGGAVGVIGLCCSPEDSREITKKLFAWYTSTELPIYQPEEPAPAFTVAPTVNCIDSITTFMTAAGVERADPIRKRRCGSLSGDVARKTVQLLNVHYGFETAPAEPVVEETPLAANEYIGEAKGFGEDPIRVKVTMDGDKISKIDILSHGETAGISDPAFKAIPDAIISAQSTTVEAVSGATMSSNGIMAAVADALSKVAK